MLRGNGAAIARADPTVLQGFDQMQEATLQRLCPGITDTGLMQASLGSFLSGLGRRRAATLARASNLASMEAATPKLETMAGLAEKAGLLQAQVFMDHVCF